MSTLHTAIINDNHFFDVFLLEFYDSTFDLQKRQEAFFTLEIIQQDDEFDFWLLDRKFSTLSSL